MPWVSTANVVKVSNQQTSSLRICGCLLISLLTTATNHSFERKAVKEKKKKNKINLWPWLSSFCLYTSGSNHIPWVSLCTKRNVSVLYVTKIPEFLSFPSPSGISTCDWQKLDHEEMGYFSTWHVSPWLPFSWSGRKVSMTSKLLMFTPHQLTSLPPKWSAGYCVKTIL